MKAKFLIRDLFAFRIKSLSLLFAECDFKKYIKNYELFKPTSF